MSELDDFLAETHPHLVADLEALRHGDAPPIDQRLPGETSTE